jgi:hypothetical protein
VKRIDVREGDVSRTDLERELAKVVPHVRRCFPSPPKRLVVRLEWRSLGLVQVSGGGGGYVVDRRGEFEVGRVAFPETTDILPDVEECIGVVFTGSWSVKSHLVIDLELEL